MFGNFCHSIPTQIMKFFPSLALLFVLVLGTIPQVQSNADPGQVAIYVGRLLEEGHFTRHRLDDDISSRLLQTYLETLDYNRLFFTQVDIERLRSQYATELDDYLLLGNPKPAFDIYELFKKRIQERVALVDKFLQKEPDFTTDRTIEISRQKSAWPKDAAEAEQLWRDRLTGEMLQVHLNESSDKSPKEVVERRYRQIQRMAEEQDENDILSTFLSSLSQVYDPHSEYMNAEALENFQINMKLSLVGIGAVLRSEDGYAKIMELVPGGPADMNGKLQVNDRISAVAQGSEEFVDVLDMPLDKVVKLIRGKKGTKVRLQVLPHNAPDPAMKSVVEIVRDEVKLTEQEAKAEIIDRIGPDGTPERLGWITLPSFYADMQGRSSTSKSTTRDVARLLERLKEENIAGLVVDLRRNGGGSLEEAVNLTGLFLNNGGPIVQAKDTQGEVRVSRAKNEPALYEGPMVVLTSRLSASASEIFAAALQDRKRAVIVGDQSTFGKGTVQTMLEIGRMMSPFGISSTDAGALKLTIQQFYRVNGGSTQLKGVRSDIVLPSLTDDPQIGEAALKNPLPYDEIDPVPADIFAKHQLPISELASRSEDRVSISKEFQYVMEDIERRRERIETNALSLNEELRRKEIAEDKKRIEERKKSRLSGSGEASKETVYSLTLENVSEPALELAKKEKKKEIEEASEADLLVDDFDAERYEALNIVSDFAALIKRANTAQNTN